MHSETPDILPFPTSFRSELHHVLKEGILIKESDITEIGELTGGIKSGREDDQEITICDLTGVGVQDTTIAALTYQKAIPLPLFWDVTTKLW